MIDQCILLVDDEPNIVQLARLYLEREGFQTKSAADGLAALRAVETNLPVLVVLDVMLPEIDGFEVCRRLRVQYQALPIILLTARDEDFDKILGLELGADDYMTKPFNPLELVARVKAVLRRSEWTGMTENAAAVRVADLSMDTDRREVRINERLIELRTQEFEVLQVLLRHPGQVFSREKLLNLAWGYDFYGQTRTVDVHIAQIRRKLMGSRIRIETVTGIGYKLVG